MADYDAMPAGREMDALVAEKVMGWKRMGDGPFFLADEREYDARCCEPSGGSTHFNYWSPSTSISAAWEVVEKMSRMPTGGFVLTEQRDGWLAHWPGVDIFASTAPLAICRAALKTLEVLDES